MRPYERLCAGSNKAKCQNVISLKLEFTFGFRLPFSFLIDTLNEAIHSSREAAGLWFALLCCGDEVVAWVLGVVWGGKVGGSGVHLPRGTGWYLMVICVEQQLCFLPLLRRQQKICVMLLQQNWKWVLWFEFILDRHFGSGND